MRFKKTILPSGLRLMTIPSKVPTVTVMVMVEAGSSYEPKKLSGLSHFLEHMCFKGTEKRPNALDISLEFDRMGAHNNAFTSSEFTAYFAKANQAHWPKLLEILSDMYLHPTLPERDLERERGVILAELAMYEDQPQSMVWHTLFTLLYGDTPAGRPIIGPRENIKAFTREDFLSYRSAHYIASKSLVVVAGDIDEARVKREVSKVFKDIPRGRRVGKEAVKDEQTAPALLVSPKETDQVHMILGLRAFGAKDPRVPALTLLAAILGGGMSSRLWHKLRQELGACYYINAHSEEYTDHGLLTLSTGVDPKRVVEVAAALVEECRKLKETLISQDELEKAKEYLVGHLYLSLETTDAQAEFFAGQEMSKKAVQTPEEMEKVFRAVSVEEIQKVAREVFQNEKLNLAVVGKVKDKAALKKVLTF